MRDKSVIVWLFDNESGLLTVFLTLEQEIKTTVLFCQGSLLLNLTSCLNDKVAQWVAKNATFRPECNIPP